MVSDSTYLDKVREFFAHDPEKDQWSDRPVPDDERLGVWEPTSVWIGFAIAYVVAFIGAQIYFGLGMPEAIYAIVLGNSVLVIYSGALAYAAAEGGLNFPLQVKEAFGRRGALLPVAIMGLLVNGWYAYQAWLAADVIRAAWNPPWIALAIGVTVIFGIPAIIGIEAMSDVVTKVVIPLMVIAALYMLITRIIPAGWGILNQPAPGESIPFMVGVGMAWGTFAVSGTATGDIVRFAKDTRQALVATVVAFLLCNTGMMVLGALAAAAINKLDPYFGMIGVLGSVPVVIIAAVSCWSTCDACLYGSTMSYTNLSDRLTWRVAAVGGVLIATAAAVTGIISNLVSWLILIGLLVPPIGGIIIADYFLIRRSKGYDVARDVQFNWPAIGTLVLAVVVNYHAFNNYPQILTGLPGLILGIVLYPVLLRVISNIAGHDSIDDTLEPRQPAATSSDD